MGSLTYGAPGVALNLRGQPTNTISLPAGGVFTIPSGSFIVTPGSYSFIQNKDPISGRWMLHSTVRGNPTHVVSDGQNWRVANLTGCVIGTRLTNAGTGYTSAPTVAFSAGGATATAVMGQVVDTTATIVTAGSGMTYAPECIVSPPPQGGLPAKAIATITNGALTGITITDQGAGYGNGPTGVTASTNAPTITFVANPNDPNLASIVLPTATLALSAASAGTVNAVVVTAQGTPLTAVPTISFTGGGGASAAATALMAFVVTAQTVSGGAGYAAPVLYLAQGGVVTTAAAYTTTLNPLGITRPATGVVTLAADALSSVTIVDGGLFQAVPSPVVWGTDTTTTTGTVDTPTVGGVTDTIVYQAT